MELALVLSIISICGFAGALSYNVYEFRKVGRNLDKMNESLVGFERRSERGHERMIRSLDRMNESLVRFERRSERGHERMIRSLDRMNESLVNLVKSSKSPKG